MSIEKTIADAMKTHVLAQILNTTKAGLGDLVPKFFHSTLWSELEPLIVSTLGNKGIEMLQTNSPQLLKIQNWFATIQKHESDKLVQKLAEIILPTISVAKLAQETIAAIKEQYPNLG